MNFPNAGMAPNFFIFALKFLSAIQYQKAHIAKNPTTPFSKERNPKPIAKKRTEQLLNGSREREVYICATGAGKAVLKRLG